MWPFRGGATAGDKRPDETPLLTITQDVAARVILTKS